jgi:hypothetical protein
VQILLLPGVLRKVQQLLGILVLVHRDLLLQVKVQQLLGLLAGQLLRVLHKVQQLLGLQHGVLVKVQVCPQVEVLLQLGLLRKVLHRVQQLLGLQRGQQHGVHHKVL